MIYEKRTYTINPLKMADWLALYQSDAPAVQTDHLGQLIGFFFTEIGVVNQVVHIWAYESPRTIVWCAARGWPEDERWQTFSRKNRELAAVERLESVLMRPTAFSPLQ
ncbi:NIPSNAP family protein [Klebsiella pneumoniae]|uniref:NIPSNAP family protein n=1 Tax=Klebsiella pneumoniae TaxID=573 RepID=A0A927HP90_KLEPN|nr:NIPSNAP family protein [Klebsiella pneumoniae]